MKIIYYDIPVNNLKISSKISIDGKRISKNDPVYFIAEIVSISLINARKILDEKTS